jgi:hypothetical protein
VNGRRDSRDVARKLIIRVVGVLSVRHISSNVFVTFENHH